MAHRPLLPPEPPPPPREPPLPRDWLPRLLAARSKLEFCEPPNAPPPDWPPALGAVEPVEGLAPAPDWPPALGAVEPVEGLAPVADVAAEEPRPRAWLAEAEPAPLAAPYCCAVCGFL
jgi:hypothetical protein